MRLQSFNHDNQVKQYFLYRYQSLTNLSSHAVIPPATELCKKDSNSNLLEDSERQSNQSMHLQNLQIENLKAPKQL